MGDGERWRKSLRCSESNGSEDREEVEIENTRVAKI